MKLRPPTDRMIIQLLPESESASLNRCVSDVIVAPDKRDRYNNQQHVPDALRIGRVLALGEQARAFFDGAPPARVLVHFAAGEPLVKRDQRLIWPEELLAVIE